MNPKINWFKLTFIAFLNSYWYALAGLLMGKAAKVTVLALGLVIFAAVFTSVIRLFQRNAKILCWLLSGLMLAVFLGVLVDPVNGMKSAFIFVLSYFGVLILTPLLLNKTYFWIIFLGGMFWSAYIQQLDDTLGYAVIYLVSGLSIAAWHEGVYNKKNKVTVIPIPLWQRVLWPMLFAFLTIGSVLAVHVPLSASVSELRTMVVNQVLTLVRLNKTPTYNVIQNLEAGGNIYPTDIMFMRVSAHYPDYWRGQSFDVYTGTGWRKVNDQVALIREEQEEFEENMKQTGCTVQQFTLAANTKSEIFFSGYNAKALIYNAKHYSVDPLGELVIFPGVSGGESYQVFVDKSQKSAEQLGLQTASDYPDDEWMINYLQLPDELPERITTLSQKLIRGCTNRYQKVKKIEAYLKANYPYTLSITKTPAGEDMVNNFLFNMKKGYCTYHASAMAVMLRTVNIPTRLVTGFTSGKWQEEEGIFKVYDRDAHAWVEVYFPRIGWVAFEPTPSFQYPLQQSEQIAAPLKSYAVSNPKDNLPTKIVQPRYIYWGSGICASLIGLVVLILAAKRQHGKMFPQQVSPITSIYLQLLNHLAQKGHTKPNQLTPLEYLQGLRSVLGANHPLAEKIVMAYLAELYGGKQHSKETIQELRRTLEKFKQHRYVN